MTEDELIERYIEPNPHKPWASEARLIDYGVPVWALVGHMNAVYGEVAQVAKDYHLPEEAVEAALAFYRRHQGVIDARLEENAADFTNVHGKRLHR
jgi:uncharacterized protein (DUF433 family)